MKGSVASLIAMVAMLTFGIGIGFTLAQTSGPSITSPFTTYLPSIFVQTSRAAPGAGVEDPATESLMLSGSDFGGNAPYILVSGGGRAGQHLPQHAKLGQITVWYSMTETITYTSDIVLERQQRGSFTSLATATIPGNQALGEHELVITVPEGTVIDNRTFGYRIRLQAAFPPTGLMARPSPLFYITQMRVDYQRP